MQKTLKVDFVYDKEKDTWCLLNKGKSSNNSPTETKEYTELVSQYGDVPTPEKAGVFIDSYILGRGIDITEQIAKFQSEWDTVGEEYQKRAERIFGVSLPADVTAYLTINSRHPYDIATNHFFVSAQAQSIRRTVMHELWHFYTWYAFGADEEKRLGKEKYNDLKEALTVLLNTECANLLPEGVLDNGYPQHAELRIAMLDFWQNGAGRDIRELWSHFAK